MTKIYVLTLAVASLFIQSAFAASSNSGSKSLPAASSLNYSGSSSNEIIVDRLGLGLATVSNVSPADAALSAWIELNHKSSIQGIFSIVTTSPFVFVVGGAYRYTLTDGDLGGFHVGGYLNVGTQSVASATGSGAKFAASFGPLAGFHFSLPGLNRVGFSLDGAAALNIVDGSSTFHMFGLSPALGLSVHYFL